ncbi:hypothetical protein EST38_g12463 [Candolleomyces aberdarensis]|uniref:Uncharacterized protein n=1 Tax=Candolleomyces aberdarensis TaxID=2316362 RepID=A0A4Q2D2D1_9AGAR|nr:hypothetical protein EST38_g12463 [Candolleomyces aberdarensis]
MANYFQVLFESTSPLHWRELMQAFGENWKYLVSDTVIGLVIMIGDALLVYRCYIVCVEYWWVAILPLTTSLSALVLFFISTYTGAEDDNYLKYSAASTFLTVSTNIIVTSFITFRLLRVRRALAMVLQSTDAQVFTGVIAILIESAAPLTIFGIIAAILQHLNGSQLHQSPGFLVCSYLFEGLFYSFCAISPQMIIFRVTTGRSFTKFPAIRDGVTNEIQFAHQTAESSFLRSTLNRELGRNRDPDVERGNASGGKPEPEVLHIAQEKQCDSDDMEKAY